MRRGDAEFLLCHHDPELPELFEANRFPSVVVGRDRIVPVSAAGPDGAPLWRFPGAGRVARAPAVLFRTVRHRPHRRGALERARRRDRLHEPPRRDAAVDGLRGRRPRLAAAGARPRRACTTGGSRSRATRASPSMSRSACSEAQAASGRPRKRSGRRFAAEARHAVSAWHDAMSALDRRGPSADCLLRKTRTRAAKRLRAGRELRLSRNIAPPAVMRPSHQIIRPQPARAKEPNPHARIFHRRHPGDGIGTEVIAAGLEVLESLARARSAASSSTSTLSTGAPTTTRSTASRCRKAGSRQLKTFDAIFFGAVGAPDVPDHVSLWGLRLPICQGFDQYANVRPARVLPGITSPLRERGPRTSTG